MLLQHVYKPVFNFIYSNLTSKIDEKIRRIIIFVCFALLTMMHIFNYSRFSFWTVHSFTDQSIIGCVVLFVVICMSINDYLDILRYDRMSVFIYTLSYLCAIFILIASLHHDVGTGMEMLAVTLAVAFPGLYFVWNNRRDYEVLFGLLAKAIVLVGCIYYMYCLICVPASDDLAVYGRYYGYLKNFNFVGFISVAVFLCAAYLVSIGDAFKYLYVSACGAAVIFAVLSGSRAAMVNIVLIFVICCVFAVRRGPRKNIKTEERKLTEYIIILAIVTIVVSAIFFITCMDGMNGTLRIFNIMSLTSVDLNTISSGRAELWAYYANELNLLGNHLENGHKGPVGWAHINALEIGYRTGFINGVIYLMIEVIMGVYALIYIFSKKYINGEYLFAALAIIVFCSYSVLDVAIFPFYTPPTLLFYIGIAPVFTSRANKTSS